ncbi:MAG: DNA polymerase III subunit gamma/tau [Alphaproteobacteria bacterium]|nr:DNA polymerase III subunit gamma/tau [Alphaproteobacteria bacterium]
MTDLAETAAATTPYRVLARKYRPGTFTELVGQAPMVTTLTNAMAMGRLAHAFVLTGVRGVGKTTTARIIARALNCVGPDGSGGPTPEPCGICANCVAIAEDRHIDVIEMDAASRTGVDDIREIIEGVRYKPVTARFKVYIIDEVHMLSRNAFNALLKTLEEPPEHVKFVFATTEIRKVPVTVLSRCQRFDLRRVDLELLESHLADIAQREGAAVAPAAIAVLARAADGSVRDGLSLLDQAIGQATGEVTADHVRDMLGLADRTQLFDLFDHLMKGEIAAALDLVETMYKSGADPVAVVQDLLDHTHWITRMKVAADAARSAAVSDVERQRGTAMAEALPMPVLTRAWQMMLKGLGEVQGAPSPLPAVEMVLIRLAYAAEMPPPGDLVRRLQQDDAPAADAKPPPAPPPPADNGNGAGVRAVGGDGNAVLAPAADPTPEGAAEAASFEQVVALFEANREQLLASHLTRNVHLVKFERGRIEIRPTRQAPANLANQVGQMLGTWTGDRWVVTVSGEDGAPTLADQADARRRAEIVAAAEIPLVRAALDTFPGATIEAVREISPTPDAAADDDSEEA